MIGRIVKVIVDRPIGSVHPKHKDLIYPLNYGYVDGILAGDGEEQDSYIIGINYPLNVFIGEIIAIIHRKNDIEDKWVVAPKESKFTKQQIIDATKFQEKFFDSEVIVI
mgnify:FL=1